MAYGKMHTQLPWRRNVRAVPICRHSWLIPRIPRSPSLVWNTDLTTEFQIYSVWNIKVFFIGFLFDKDQLDELFQ